MSGSGGRALLFAYGSLVSRSSLHRTLGRWADPIPAWIEGRRRAWTLARDNLRSEKTFAAGSVDGPLPRWCLGLDLGESGPGANGALVELGPDELRRLDAREVRYRRVEVTDSVRANGPGPWRLAGLPVFAYVARGENHRPEPPEGAVIIGAYLREVESAFAELGPDQLRLYRETTEAPPVEVIEAFLVHDEIPPGNPREW